MTVDTNEVKIIRIPYQRMIYELLEDITKEWTTYLDGGFKKFVIDMSKVSFMDSASIGCLMDFYRKTKSAEGRIHLAAVQPRIHTLLSIAKAKTLFGIYDTVGEAVDAFQQDRSTP
jgi:anti-anti-sigma factor